MSSPWRRCSERSVGSTATSTIALAHLDSLDQLVVDRDLLLAAGRLGPDGLRTLDAIHLAAAGAAGGDLGGVVTYDSRMAEAGQALGLEILAPGP